MVTVSALVIGNLVLIVSVKVLFDKTECNTYNNEDFIYDNRLGYPTS